MGRIMAIDYGRKRVGIAVTDTLQISANGLATVEENKAIDFIRKYVAENGVDEIVVGYATHADGTDTHSTPFIRRFIADIQKYCPQIPVIKREEAFTSRMAVKIMLDSGVRKKARRQKENIDKMSAVLILQDYIQNR